MDIENLTRFLPSCSLDKVPMPIMMQTLEEDSYVRFLDVKEASSNSLQQLKAEIAACVERYLVAIQATNTGSPKLPLILRTIPTLDSIVKDLNGTHHDAEIAAKVRDIIVRQLRHR